MSPNPAKRRILSVTVAMILGSLLMGFQNCSPGMKANQQFENDVLAADRKSPEMLENVTAEEDGMAIKSFGKLVSCPASGLPLRWPFGGQAFKEWAVINYVDRNPSAGAISDYMGKSHTYDNHLGVDIDVPSFRQMDLDYPVLAAADGEVIEVVQGYYDRNRTCVPNENNYVKIQHANSYRTIYVHLKRGSVVVTVGQRVVAGQKLGVVGSSGCSNYPHLHFEVRDCNGKMVDPLYTKMFSNAPAYTPQGPSTIMDTVLKQPQMTTIENMVDPGPLEPESVSVANIFSLGLTISSLKANNVIRIDLVRPDGVQVTGPFQVTNSVYRAQSHWYWNFKTAMPGEWTAKFSIDGVAKGERKFMMTP